MSSLAQRIQEGEHCCDDVAVAICGDRIAYARALTAMEELRVSFPRWAVASQGGSLIERIRRLFGLEEHVSRSKLANAMVAALIMFVAGVMLLPRTSKGRFSILDIPTGFKWHFLVEPAKRRPPWNAWASGMFPFSAVSEDAELLIEHDGKELSASRFELQVLGNGVNWRTALNIGASHQTLALSGDPGLGNERVHVRAARLVLSPRDAVP